jgi:hypothetical protein
MHPAQVMFFGMAFIFIVSIICLLANERHTNKGQIWNGKEWV